jgi:hypothetical protein
MHAREQEHDDGLTEEEKAEAKRVKMQKHVMDEILATERDYVKDLTFVVEVHPLRRHPPWPRACWPYIHTYIVRSDSSFVFVLLQKSPFTSDSSDP